jgi:hypothetical protein
VNLLHLVVDLNKRFAGNEMLNACVRANQRVSVDIHQGLHAIEVSVENHVYLDGECVGRIPYGDKSVEVREAADRVMTMLEKMGAL